MDRELAAGQRSFRLPLSAFILMKDQVSEVVEWAANSQLIAAQPR
jgi:hypothetical protein